ncbi:putative protein OS=Tsukamurella paurometabola (strain ATCC 8368 / DSM / CCUG 35730 /CIP 100753 / JCM 10117 / KCTC 9821 / NBRC 16120 / NCIMB 702349/ NCTC 13040) OX=521096 GN=Tpau_3019 PE=4 SV=1 [Tsukamurella paurometabola]|uniref:Uncharacterized protein n=1 Tax=Tsukamurella paurometabola (strain ATCC 8368 / DSM 20162 / CCUG 35730 / CIP 100753 / JCM 10117 / KCTC 9821 / NBRC 16120 / NCIMB 702349 / NCTC 13040) TaxID=521096 RepID=D5UUB0_TSUPD|nr:hypothetical protein Tpau_3019 [Tsukamurella paurometabola DSM 20162]SUP36448.1 Uncharacterised protein [Tsukamurella paurometabola]
MSVENKIKIKSWARRAGAVLLTVLANMTASSTSMRVRLT